MKRLFPFVFTTLALLLSIGLLTAYRSGALAKAREFVQEHTEEVVSEIQEPA